LFPPPSFIPPHKQQAGRDHPLPPLGSFWPQRSCHEGCNQAPRTGSFPPTWNPLLQGFGGDCGRFFGFGKRTPFSWQRPFETFNFARDLWGPSFREVFPFPFSGGGFGAVTPTSRRPLVSTLTGASPQGSGILCHDTFWFAFPLFKNLFFYFFLVLSHRGPGLLIFSGERGSPYTRVESSPPFPSFPSILFATGHQEEDLSVSLPKFADP